MQVCVPGGLIFNQVQQSKSRREIAQVFDLQSFYDELDVRLSWAPAGDNDVPAQSRRGRSGEVEAEGWGKGNPSHHEYESEFQRLTAKNGNKR